MTTLNEEAFLTHDPVASGSRSRSRPSDSRSHNMRQASARPPLAYHALFGVGSRFNVSDEVKDADPDHEYAYAPYACRNQDLSDDFDRTMERYWMPVEETLHPSLTRNRMVITVKKRKSEDPYLRKGGQVMVRREKEYCEAEREYHDSNKFHENKMIEMFKGSDARSPYMFQHQRNQSHNERF